MKKVDRWVALGSILFAAIALFIIPREIAAVGSSVVIMSARTYPTFAAIAIIVCSLGLLLTSFLSHDDTAAPTIIRAEELKVLLVLGIILAYAIACEYLGFFISTILVGNVFMLVFKDRTWYHHVIYCVFIFACYMLFTRLLYIHLPKLGVWFF